jgi:hypothetical protein
MLVPDEEIDKSRKDFHSSTTRIERSKSLYHHIDPGFVNHRLCYNVIGAKGIELFELRRRREDDHWANLANDHLLTNIVLTTLGRDKAPSLGELIQHPIEGARFSSTEEVLGNPAIYDLDRLTNRIRLRFRHQSRVLLEYDKKKVTSDTLHSELASGGVLSIAGMIKQVRGRSIHVAPIIMGSPWLEHPLNETAGVDLAQLMWLGHNFFELLPGDIDEFSRIEEIPDKIEIAEWHGYMREMPEAEVKKKIAALLNDSVQADWGGEQEDHFSSHLHLSGRRVTASFAFKEPAKFREMTPAMLGKNGDQIYRLAATPAHVLVLQHCHDVGTAVRETLRRFAVAPHNPRHFCVMDGRDTYRLLKAYGML